MNIIVIIKHDRPENYDYFFEDDLYSGDSKKSPHITINDESYKLTGNIDKLILKKESDLNIIIGLSNSEEMSVTLKNMTVLDCIENGQMVNRFAMSKKLIKRTHKVHHEKSNITRFYFYLKSRDDYIEIMDGLYVLEDELPIELEG